MSDGNRHRPRFSQPPDETFQAAKRGNRRAIERIVENYRYLVKWVAARYFVPGWESEDLEQEGFLCLLEILQQFDPSKSKFSTYLAKCIGMRLCNHGQKDGLIRTPSFEGALVRKTTKKARELARYVRSLERVAERDVTSLADNPLEQLLAREEQEQAKKELAQRIADLEQLPKRSRNIVLRRLFGETLQQIGKRYRITKQRAQQVYERAVNSLPDPGGYHFRLANLPADWVPKEAQRWWREGGGEKTSSRRRAR